MNQLGRVAAYLSSPLLYHIYIASVINCMQPDDGHSNIDRNM